MTLLFSVHMTYSITVLFLFNDAPFRTLCFLRIADAYYYYVKVLLNDASFQCWYAMQCMHFILTFGLEAFKVDCMQFA